VRRPSSETPSEPSFDCSSERTWPSTDHDIFPWKHKKCFWKENLRNTLCVSQIFLSGTLFVFPWEKPFRNHKTCLEMGFSGGNTTQCQQWCFIDKLFIYSKHLRNTLHVSLIFLSEILFVFPWEEPFWKHKTCLEMSFSWGKGKHHKGRCLGLQSFPTLKGGWYEHWSSVLGDLPAKRVHLRSHYW